MAFDLPSLGWDEVFASACRHLDQPDHQPARVTRVDRGVCSVLACDGVRRVSLGGGVLAAAASDPIQVPCPGDWVVVRAWPDGPTTVEAILPRRTALFRIGDFAAGRQILAANADTAAVVEPAYPDADLGWIRRLLIAARDSGAAPLVVLTKIDRSPHPELIAARIARKIQGVRVCAVSSSTGAGMARLREQVSTGRTLALFGRPGAGQSSLVSAFVGAEVIGSRQRARASGSGTHAPRLRGLVPVPGGGSIIHTPGIDAPGIDGPGFDAAGFDGPGTAPAGAHRRAARFAAGTPARPGGFVIDATPEHPGHRR